MHKYIEIFLFAVRRHISFVELMAVIYWFEVERFIRLWCLCNFLSAAVNTCRQQWARWVVVVCANYRLICHITRSIDPSASCTQLKMQRDRNLIRLKASAHISGSRV